MAVAFVFSSGLDLLECHLAEAIGRGASVRILTGDYQDVTEPQALRRLLDLEGAAEVRVFEARDTSFHPKAYLFTRAGAGGGAAYVGSSNISATALRHGIEWNYRIQSSEQPRGFAEVQAQFERLFHHPATRPLSAEWISAYEARRRQPLARVEIAPEPPAPPPDPTPVQQEALAALAATRAAGNGAGLVVMATGLGKTYLSAFDSRSFRRVLFVAHREEILEQAMRAYRRVRPDDRFGRYSGQEKTPEADVLFASVQTLARLPHLRRFTPKAFDYVVVDEFHHACAATYRRLIGYFHPRFLLGLTATPERTDGGDLLTLCGENLVYRCDFMEGIQRALLSPFHYFGVPDEVDYTNIPWRSSRFDEGALTQAVATQSRAQNALDQYRERGGARTLAFCCSQRHADFMADYFGKAGLRVVAVHSGPGAAPRTSSLEQLAAGDLDVVFAVDMFNEGVDVPSIDTVMMLRPTESSILWLQQLGRGLRRFHGKERLVVIDYIGNHRTFLLKPQTLFQLGPGDAAIARALDLVTKGEAELPPGCAVTYDLEAVDILRGLLRVRPRDAEALRLYYQDFLERRGARPLAVEAMHDGYAPRSARTKHGSWLRFVQTMGGLSPQQASLLEEHGSFFDSLETTPMTRSYKMLVLQAMLNIDALPGSIDIEALVQEVATIASRSASLRADVGPALTREPELRKLVEENPIAAWAGGKGTAGVSYFAYRDGTFST
ncbi:MAG TPA: DEAD/DEAH box helicase family protein, partial [Terriglobales bacterium]|nr:DEAD/DEAH box helicase family protein [Terriglobales bacterium]